MSQSTHAPMLLARAHLAPVVEVCVDGDVAADQGLERKPAADMLLAAARRLGVEPDRWPSWQAISLCLRPSQSSIGRTVDLFLGRSSCLT